MSDIQTLAPSGRGRRLRAVFLQPPAFFVKQIELTQNISQTIIPPFAQRLPLGEVQRRSRTRYRYANGGSRRSDFSVCRASCYNGEAAREQGVSPMSDCRGNPPLGSPVAYGGKPAYSAGFTATHWLLCAWSGSLFSNSCVSPNRVKSRRYNLASACNIFITILLTTFFMYLYA
ncbi:hypothetical protein [Nostoc sp.]|uniref:hypothetical protein n=1 Tax=Nostoc sp. TaxID=1180 RepID=UPI002FF61980